MESDLQLRTADRYLRRKYASDLPGLTTLANQLASDSLTTPITLTSSSFEGGQASGQVTMPREIWLAAAEDLLADPRFNPDALPSRPRIISPDWRLANAV